jgi:hypothetical protein
MKKILIVLPLVALIVGCGLKPPDVEAIEKLLTEELEVIATPGDDSVRIEIKGFPAELPEGLEGVSIYVDTFDMDSLPESELGTPIASGITDSTTLEQDGLENGKQYYFEGRGEMAGDTVSEVGFGGMFYPRPWGSGSYLGYNPDSTPPEKGVNNALSFIRETGHPEANQSANEGADFFFFTDGQALYITSAVVLGSTDTNGIEPAGQHISNWLEVKDSSTTYSDTVKISNGQIYRFMTADGYYGKFAVEGIDVVPPLMLGEGDALRVWLRYAFQTAQHVGHY